MIFGVSIIVMLLPLIITPGVFFAFDITPKIAVLVLGTCVMLCFANQNIKRIQGMARTSCGRWFLGLLALQWVFLAVAAALSLSRGLSLHGSGWRRFGFLTQTCVLLVGLLVGAWISEHRPRIQTILRMCVGAGGVGAAYGVFQYFGWDPLLSPKSYQAGEDVFMIVRPPGTLGHADYFAAWLVAVFFAGLALAPMEESRWARVSARAIAALAAVATLLSGTRSALLGLAAGIVVYVLVRRPRITRRFVALAAAGVACLALFFVSHAGTSLGARVPWCAGDSRAARAFFGGVTHSPWPRGGRGLDSVPRHFPLSSPRFNLWIWRALFRTFITNHRITCSWMPSPLRALLVCWRYWRSRFSGFMCQPGSAGSSGRLWSQVGPACLSVISSSFSLLPLRRTSTCGLRCCREALRIQIRLKRRRFPGGLGLCMRRRSRRV